MKSIDRFGQMLETALAGLQSLAAILILFLALPARGQVTTAQYDNARLGANLSEKILTPRNVNSTQFGKLYSLPVDGDVYAQPLYLPGVEIPGKGKHNVVFIATEHDSVYAFDADSSSSPKLWEASFLDPAKGVTTIPSRDVHCPFIRPQIGITSTPVIDPATGTLYVLARTKEGDQYVQQLHALDVATGAEKFGGPALIRAAIKTKTLKLFESHLDFDPLRENQRAALLLVNGKVIITWASSCDVGPYYGWVMSYDAHNLSQTAFLNLAPDGGETGIWQGDAGPAADKDGSIFVVTGNGKFTAASGGADYGDSVVKLSVTGAALSVRDYFTPFDQAELNSKDLDLGSSGPVLLPDQPGPHPHLLLTSGKGEGVYVIDRDTMGKFHEGSNSHAVQVLKGIGGCFGAPAYWNGSVYYLCSDDALKQFRLENGLLSNQPVAQGNTKFVDPGATPTVSANGSKDGIVWVIHTHTWNGLDKPALLFAYDASNVSRELYNSEQIPERDRPGNSLRFAIPTAVNGRVYVGVKGAVEVYGLLPTTKKK